MYSNGDGYVISATGGAPTTLTREPSNEVLPIWSRDGRWVYFASDRTGGEIFRTTENPANPVQVTSRGGFVAFESPDGQFLYYTRLDDVGCIWRQPLAGSGKEELAAPLPPNFRGQWAIGKQA